MNINVKRIRAKLDGRNLKKIARESGIHYNTIYRFYNGSNANIKTLEMLTTYLDKLDVQHDEKY